MKSTIIIALNLLLITGCSFNDVNLLTNFEPPAQDRAIIIFGLGVEGKLKEALPQLGLLFHEYNFAKQEATHICFFRYNHLPAGIENKSNEFRYFVFNVASGHYALDIEHAINGKSLAYEIPTGKIVYLGDYIYTAPYPLILKNDSEQVTTLLNSLQKPKLTSRDGSDKATDFIRSLYPKFKGQLILPVPKMVKPPVMMLCGP